MISFNYLMPAKVYFGCGVLKELSTVVDELKGESVLVVAGRSSMRKTGTLDRALGLLEKKEVTVFDEVESDPSVETVDKAVDAAREVDVIVGLGGGSAIDAAKAVSVLSANEGKAGEYIHGRGVVNPGPAIVAVPTTSGTGSEVTEVSVLSDTEARVKKSFRSVFMYPTVALDDPELTRTMPKEVTASSGLDALTHAVEAYTSKKSQPIPDVMCVRAAKIILDNIVNAYEDGGNMEARENMMLGSLMAGFGITHAGAGLAHGLSYSLWRVALTPHGLACGMLLPHVMRFNLGYDEGRYDVLARYCGFKSPEDLIARIEEVNAALGVPKSLGEIGVEGDNVESMVELGMSGSTKVNPRPVDESALASFIGGIM